VPVSAASFVSTVASASAWLQVARSATILEERLSDSFLGGGELAGKVGWP
jgi:hypothetical protein